MTIEEYKRAYNKLDVEPLGDTTYFHLCPICAKPIIITHKQLTAMIAANEIIKCDECNKQYPDTVIKIITRQRRKISHVT